MLQAHGPTPASQTQAVVMQQLRAKLVCPTRKLPRDRMLHQKRLLQARAIKEIMSVSSCQTHINGQKYGQSIAKISLSWADLLQLGAVVSIKPQMSR